MDKMDEYFGQMAEAEQELAQRNLVFEAEFHLEQLRSEILSERSEVAGTTWGCLKGSAMKPDYEVSE